MKLQQVLNRHRDGVLGRWKELVFATYPRDSSGFMANNADRFANPVGHATAEGLEAIYDALASGRSPRDLASELDLIVRVRVVQDFTPSQAVGFVLLLKKATREQIEQDADADQHAVDRLVDDLLLAAFDAYARCRDQMQEIRARDLKRRTYQLVEMAQRMTPEHRSKTHEEGPGQ